MKTRFWSMAAIILAAAATRLLPHPPNFTPIAAIALFGGAHFDRRAWAFLVPLAAMLLSDAVFELWFGWGAHRLLPVVYLTFAAVVAIGIGLRARRKRVGPVAGATLAAATLFFVTTNFAVWATGTLYPRTVEGLLACYTAAIPFFGWTLAGDLFYTAALFGGFALLESRLPALAPPHRTAT